MIEFVISASPETIRNEPPEGCSFAQSAIGGTWQPCAFMNPDVFAFPFLGKALRQLPCG
jgi:hypothetical protein